MPDHLPEEDAKPPDRNEKELFLGALEIEDSAERAAWLKEACGAANALHARLVELLEAEEEEDGDEFLEPNQERLGEVVSAVGRELREDEADTMLSDVDAEPTPAPGEVAGVSEQVGDTIDRYKLLQRLGEGGGGVVYLAKQTEPVKRKVALKVIKLGMDTRQVVARFEAERQALAMMDHPNIAKVLDGGATASGRPYFVMEVVRGVPITKFCDDNNLSTVERLELFTQVCEAVQHAHQKGIIHRDLKPGNILVTMLEDRPLPKVIDFGIAKATQQELTEKTIFTQMGHFIGTPAYMSPEQAQLTEYDIDTRSDIYALGVVLYELLTGQTPFDTRELLKAGYDEIRRLIREETPEKPSTRLSTSRTGQTGRTSQTLDPRALRGDLDWIVMKALEKDRRRRYETANGLALDIGRHLRNEPVAAGPPSAGYRLKKFVRRNRRGLLSGAVAAVALLGGLSVAGVMWLNERERVTKVEEQAGTLIGQAEDLMETNAAAEDYYDDEAFRRAEALVNQLTLLGGLDRAGEELRARRDRLVAAVASERRDRDLILGIEEAVMMRMGTGGGGSVDAMRTEVEKSFAAAFKLYGKNPAEAPVDDTIAWLEPRREEVRDMILAGMLEWAYFLKENSPEGAARLNEVVASMDPDPWREELRRAIDEEDRPALEQLAASEEVSGQTIMTVLNLARALREAESRAVMETLLRRAQREHPENFWTNFALGDVVGDRLDGTEYDSGEEGVGLTLAVSIVGDSNRRESKPRPEYDEAIGFNRAAAAARPDAAAAWSNLGHSLTGGRRLDDAVASFRKAIELKPDLALAHINLGNALGEQGKLNEEIASYRKAIELAPDMAAAHVNLGTALVGQGKLDEAIASCRKAIALTPDLAAAHVNLGNALMEQGKLDEAIASFRKAIQLDQGLAVAHYNLGYALKKQNILDDAIASFKTAIKLDPNMAAAHSQLGSTLGDKGQFDNAIESHQRAIGLAPDVAAAHTSLAHTLREHGKLEEAIGSYRRAIELEPDHAGAHFNLGNALLEQGKLDDAIASYRTATERDPSHVGAHVNLGNALLEQGKLDEAIPSYEIAIKLDPDLVLAYTNLGLALQKQGKFDKAIPFCQRAAELDPRNAMAHFNLGAAFGMNGALDEAIVSFKTAIDLNPDLAMAHSNLGVALQKKGLLAEAIACFRESLKLEPSPQKRSFIQALEEKDAQLLDIVREKGAGDHSIPALVREIFVKVPFADPPEARVREFWEDHREDLAEALGSAEVRIITLLKNHPDDLLRTAESAKALAHELAGKLAAGADFGELAKEFSEDTSKGELKSKITWGEELSEALDLAAFTLEVGAISEVIEAPNCYFLLKVEKRQAGKADDFDDPKVRGVAAALLTAQRRKDMEQAYLERLQERIEEEKAGNAAEANDAK